jgi:7-cyano-7-deazaguanine reductase
MPTGLSPAPWVALDCERFTSLCPVTGQPDWATLKIAFIPDNHLVESKSLKEYLGSFRMHGDFHEDVCRIILRDIITCARPRYAEVFGDFDSRGSIAIWPLAQWARADDHEAQTILEHRRLHFAPRGWPQQSR